MHPKIHQWAAWSEGYEEIKQKTDRKYKSINCLMLVFSCRLEALGLCLHGYSCFIGFQGLFVLEQLAWADWMYHQLMLVLSISFFPHKSDDSPAAAQAQSSLPLVYMHVETPSNVRSRWSVCCAGSRAVMRLFRGSTRIWRTKCTER